jgi:hypothetical protein
MNDLLNGENLLETKFVILVLFGFQFRTRTRIMVHFTVGLVPRQQAMKARRGLSVDILIRGVRWRCMVRAKLRLFRPREHLLSFGHNTGWVSEPPWTWKG